MATVYPTTEEEMAKINGVGMGKIIKFGKPFLALIQEEIGISAKVARSIEVA